MERLPGTTPGSLTIYLTHSMILTVSGPPGSGTTTLATALADAYGLDHLDGGDIFRTMADERGMTEAEFGKHVNENPHLDREIDRRLSETVDRYVDGDAADESGLVLESRLAGWLAGEDADFRLWCTAPVDVRAARLSDRDGRSETRDQLLERQADEAMRYEDTYGIDITDLSIYDLVVNTARWDERMVCEVVQTAVDGYSSTADEGLTPTDSPF